MRDCSFRQQVKFLVNDADAQILGVDRVVEGYIFILEEDGPLILFIGADHYFHQGGFASAILTYHRINLSREKLD